MGELSRFFDVRAPMPCIIRNLPLFQRAVERWDCAYLARHMGSQLYHVFASGAQDRRFAYSFDERNEGGYEPASIAKACKMTFAEFVEGQRTQKDGNTYYLQTALLRYDDDKDGVITCARFDEDMEADLRSIDNGMVKKLQDLGSFGPISRNQLFVSFSDYLTAVHYDQQHNLFLQFVAPSACCSSTRPTCPPSTPTRCTTRWTGRPGSTWSAPTSRPSPEAAPCSAGAWRRCWNPGTCCADGSRRSAHPPSPPWNGGAGPAGAAKRPGSSREARPGAAAQLPLTSSPSGGQLGARHLARVFAPGFRGRGGFLPMSWFHHVHSLGPENISMNFWFYDSGALFSPGGVGWPLAAPSVVELSRHVEYFVAEQLGPLLVGPFMQWWLGDGHPPEDALLADRWRLMRNYILRRLSGLSSRNGGRVLAMLDPRRWQGLRHAAVAPRGALHGLRDEHRASELLGGLPELGLGVFRCSMPARAYRLLGRAIDAVPREKLRVFLECAEEALVLVKDGTDWGSDSTGGPEAYEGGPLFQREEARQMPRLILHCLEEICELAAARRVCVETVDNGLFANWLQVADACLFASDASAVQPRGGQHHSGRVSPFLWHCLPRQPCWILSGREREFNYGAAGEDLFRALFEAPEPPGAVDAPGTAAEDHEERQGGIGSARNQSTPNCPFVADRGLIALQAQGPEPPGAAGAQGTAAEERPFVVRQRYNVLLVNVFRGRFLCGPGAGRRRRLYGAAAARLLRPRAAAREACRRAVATIRFREGTVLVGVHKRVDNPGTARMQIAQVVPSTQAYILAVERLVAQRGCAEDFAVALATDDEAAVPLFRDAFGHRLLHRDVLRSTGGVNERQLPREVHGQEGRLSAGDAQDCLVDAMILAECDVMIHADSNVTIAAGIMNPDMEAVHIRDLVRDASPGGQFEAGRGIFDCDEYAVYSNEELDLAPGLRSRKIDSDLRCEKGGEFGTALNTDIFLALWAKVLDEGRFMLHGWTAKVDPDAVFLPNRLRSLLTRHSESPQGAYLNNCKMGMHGPVEVFSRNALQAFGRGKDHCLQHFTGLCSGPCKWGEDMFLDQCLWKVLNVTREFEWALLQEDHCDPPPGWQACNAPGIAAFHPFKTVKGYQECLGSASAVDAA
ncbi:unnamed protein product [Prorocentrum cordatum]|uniref:Uncharacterized protein n=1 Tax=Prorocentrum cordatum TaxID=2364126 RepID=A0ABN9SXP8_9DINO|nr:unnamed protein product [Polarella glacialis]